MIRIECVNDHGLDFSKPKTKFQNMYKNFKNLIRWWADVPDHFFEIFKSLIMQNTVIKIIMVKGKKSSSM